MLLTPGEARYAYASMIDTLDVSWINTLLAEDFIYVAPFLAFPEKKISSRQLYLDFITAELDAIRAIPCRTLWATLGSIMRSSWADPCVILSWGELENYVAVATLQTVGEKITRIDLRELPDPQQVRPSGWDSRPRFGASFHDQSKDIREQVCVTRPQKWPDKDLLF